jgi:lysozyme family protein
MAYNSGCKTATIILQRVVGAEPDGVIGPKTLAAVSHMPTIRAIQLYGGLCEDYYESLNNPVFIDGWLDRNVRRTKAALAMATK